MAASEDLIDFNVIESHKENIQALPSGRSAKALAQIYSPPLLGATPSPAAAQDAHSAKRAEFDRELQNIEEADDPLDVYDRYVKWTLDAYPSAQATPQSQLLPLLERATKAFQSSSHYKNDPRYLKIWLHYIRLFSDAPREAFVFLARQSIGESLALYYEEFAAWLENAGRWQQAKEVYKMGLEKNARPAERLLRKFGEFERRNQARPADPAEPTSPAVPMARPALAAKMDPFVSASPSTEPAQQAKATAKKSKSSKMAIFSDDDVPPRPDSGSGFKGWDNIGTLADRKKENSREAKPWVGEKLQGGKTNGGVEKMMVFKDQTSSCIQSLQHQQKPSLPRHLTRQSRSSAHEQQCVPNPKNGRLECVFVDLEAVYPENGKVNAEYCFEELRARHRGWLSKDRRRRKTDKPDMSGHWKDNAVEPAHTLGIDHDQQQSAEPEVPQTGGNSPVRRQKQHGFQIFEDAVEPSKALEPTDEADRVLVETFSKQQALNDENDENAPPSRGEIDLAKKQRREERANRTRKIQVLDVKHVKNETKTIQLNMDSPTGPKLKRKKSGERPEPTMTINTREAMDEIYGIFNQPLPVQAEQTDGEEEESDDEDGYTTGDESTNTGKLSGAGSEYGDDTRNELLKSTADDEDRTDVSSWSDFTTCKHVPQGEHEPTQDSVSASAQNTSWEVYQDQDLPQSAELLVEDVVTPLEDEHPRTTYIPIPPEGYEHYSGPYRDAGVVANNKLPFMTPIVEQTESSLSVGTGRTERSGFSAKTPSRKAGVPESLIEDDDDALYSSPFQEIIADNEEDKRRVLQPIRTKSTKGTISLGHGSAKSQIAAKSVEESVIEPVHKGPIIKDEQCNPMDPQLRQTILAQLKPSLSSFEGYHEHLDVTSGRTGEIKKYIRTLVKSSRSSTNLEKTMSTLSLPPTLTFEGGDGTYTIKRQLGAGTFAPVYLVENSAAVPVEDADENEENRPPSRVGKSVHRKQLEAVKMEEPASTWEFYILRQSHRRLGVSRAAESIVRAHEMHLFRDECFLVEEYQDQGTLLDLVNLARVENGNGGGMDELLAMWLTVELLRTVEALHSKQIIHGDLKGDNVLIRFDDPGTETDWSPTYFPSGAHGWASKGICLIDMGRGIDMKHFVPNVAFIADWKTSEADCAEMRELRPWTYQIDYHGLAGIIHSMLFGKYMETVGEKGGSLGQGATKTYRIRENLKRYWQTDIWGELFSLLLNPLTHLDAEEGKKMPVLRSLKASRERMECWLEENCERGVGLKGMVVKMEAAIRDRRRKSIKA